MIPVKRLNLVSLCRRRLIRGRASSFSSSPPPAEQSAEPDAMSRGLTLSSGLYLVSTPIGNLQDITLRALNVLRQANLILCEDTRHSARLLQHYQIITPLSSYHEHNEKHRTNMAVQRIRAGEAVALISDAGTPCVSDPGAVIVQAAIASGVTVFPIPGPAAFVSAAISSGLDLSSLLYLGFLPPKSGARLSKLQSYSTISSTMTFYVAPHSLRSTLSDMILAFGGSRRVCIAREITKVHEEFYRCLLYTSPSPRDRQKSRMPSSA